MYFGTNTGTHSLEVEPSVYSRSRSIHLHQHVTLSLSQENAHGHSVQECQAHVGEQATSTEPSPPVSTAHRKKDTDTVTPELSPSVTSLYTSQVLQDLTFQPTIYFHFENITCIHFDQYGMALFIYLLLPSCLYMVFDNFLLEK